MTEPLEHRNLDIHGELEKVASVVAAARRVLSQGRMVDISGLQARVAKLCEAIMEQAPNNAPPLRHAMESLLADLDRLSDDLTRQFGIISGTGEDSNVQKGLSAYARAKIGG